MGTEVFKSFNNSLKAFLVSSEVIFSTKNYSHQWYSLLAVSSMTFCLSLFQPEYFHYFWVWCSLEWSILWSPCAAYHNINGPFCVFLSVTADVFSSSVQQDVIQKAQARKNIIATQQQRALRGFIALRGWAEPPMGHYRILHESAPPPPLLTAENNQWAPFRWLYNPSWFMVWITSCTGCLWCEH